MGEQAESQEDDGGARFHRLADLPWEGPAQTPQELRAVATQSSGGKARRAQVATGDLDLYAQMVEMPAGFVVPPHRHSAHELMVVLEGGCTIDGGHDLAAGDMAEVPGGTEYGFTVFK